MAITNLNVKLENNLITLSINDMLIKFLHK